MISKEMHTDRSVHIDLLRIIASFLVIVNHTNSEIFENHQPCATWFVSIAYFFVSRLAVPVFLMITGYTLLTKQDSYRKTFDRVTRIVIALIVFSALYYVNEIMAGTRVNASIFDFFRTIFNEPITVAFWYMYMYVGVLLMMPFLQKLVANLRSQDFYIFFGISIIVYAIWPILVHYIPNLQYSNNFGLSLFGSYICMLFLGYYIRKYVQKDKRMFLGAIVTFGLSLLANVILTYIEYQNKNGLDYLFFSNISLVFILLEGVTVFYLAQFFKCGPKVGKVICEIGKCTFGIYLLSDFFINKFKFVFYALGKYMHPLMAVLFFECFVFVCGLLVTKFLKIVPGIRKVL